MESKELFMILSLYQAYELKAQIIDVTDMRLGDIFTVKVLDYYQNTDKLVFKYSDYQGADIVIERVKPILKPLSMLTKEIEHKGERFVPIYYSAFKTDKQHLIEFQNKYAHYKSVKFGIMEKLLEWHFDVFGLIEKGLAIDESTLTKD